MLEIDIARGPDRPYLAPDKDDQYVAYLRVADENRPADPTLVLAWKKLRHPDGRLFRLTRPVEALFRHLETHSSVSLSEFCRVAHIRRRLPATSSATSWPSAPSATPSSRTTAASSTVAPRRRSRITPGASVAPRGGDPSAW